MQLPHQNPLPAARRLLRRFGGLNESYGCAEGELRKGLNFSARGWPALATRLPRARLCALQQVQGLCYLGGLFAVCGTAVQYTPAGCEQPTVQLPQAVADTPKQLAVMGKRILIWPDALCFDTETGALAPLAAAWQQAGTLVLRLCDEQGTVYRFDQAGSERPEHAEDGWLYLQRGSESGQPYASDATLWQYSAASQSWARLAPDCVRLECGGLAAGAFSAGDSVTLAGLPQQVCEWFGLANGQGAEITAAFENCLVIRTSPGANSHCYYGECSLSGSGSAWAALFANGAATVPVALPAAGEVSIRREVPQLDYIVEHNNRLWGCSSAQNAIYASRLGDPFNWYSYQGLASDSYAVTVGSPGPFTGAASCGASALFFKADMLHRLYGAKPSDFQLAAVRCAGVAPGAAASLAVLDETLYYLSPDGVMAWAGGLPVRAGTALAPEGLQNASRAVGGVLDGRYYLWLQRPQGQRLLVLDTLRGLWQEEQPAGAAMLTAASQLCLWDGETLWLADPARGFGCGSPAAPEQAIPFEMQTGDIGLDTPEDQYLSRITLRLDAPVQTSLTVQYSADGGAWQTVGEVTLQGQWLRVELPFAPARHDTVRLRLAGSGQLALRSVAFTFADARGAQIAGALPRARA